MSQTRHVVTLEDLVVELIRLVLVAQSHQAELLAPLRLLGQVPELGLEVAHRFRHLAIDVGAPFVQRLLLLCGERLEEALDLLGRFRAVVGCGGRGAIIGRHFGLRLLDVLEDRLDADPVRALITLVAKDSFYPPCKALLIVFVLDFVHEVIFGGVFICAGCFHAGAIFGRRGFVSDAIVRFLCSLRGAFIRLRLGRSVWSGSCIFRGLRCRRLRGWSCIGFRL